MEITMLLVLFGCKLTVGTSETIPTTNETKNDPRSAEAIFESIYGPPIQPTAEENRPSRRASSAQYPMIAATYAMTFDSEEHTWSEVFIGVGVIVTEWVVISSCSYFFSAQDYVLVKKDVYGAQSYADEDEMYFSSGTTPHGYLIHAGNYSIPNATGIESTTK